MEPVVSAENAAKKKGRPKSGENEAASIRRTSEETAYLWNVFNNTADLKSKVPPLPLARLLAWCYAQRVFYAADGERRLRDHSREGNDGRAQNRQE